MKYLKIVGLVAIIILLTVGIFIYSQEESAGPVANMSMYQPSAAVDNEDAYSEPYDEWRTYKNESASWKIYSNDYFGVGYPPGSELTIDDDEVCASITTASGFVVVELPEKRGFVPYPCTGTDRRDNVFYVALSKDVGVMHEPRSPNGEPLSPAEVEEKKRDLERIVATIWLTCRDGAPDYPGCELPLAFDGVGPYIESITPREGFGGYAYLNSAIEIRGYNLASSDTSDQAIISFKRSDKVIDLKGSVIERDANGRQTVLVIVGGACVPEPCSVVKDMGRYRVYVETNGVKSNEVFLEITGRG